MPQQINPIRLFIISFGFLAALIIGGSVLSDQYLAAHEQDSRVVNISGRQRMLSQKISKVAVELAAKPDAEVSARLTVELADALALWERSYNALRFGDAELGIAGNNSPTIDRLYANLDPTYEQMLDSGKTIVTLIKNNRVESAEFSYAVSGILSNENRFLTGMNDVVFTHEQEASTYAEKSRLIVFLIYALLFLSLVFSWFLIVRPALRRVIESTKELLIKTEEAKDSEMAALNIAADLKAEEEKLAGEKTKAESLANDLKKFKLALDNTSDQVIIADPEGIVVYGNAAIEKVTGYKPEEAVGKKAGALWHLPMPLEYYQNFWHTIKDSKSTFLGEIQNKRKSGEIYTAMINVSPVLDNDGNIIFFVGLERDITKEKEIDTAKSEFISLASHQLRTPLTAINWYAEMLLGGDAGKLSKKQKEYFDEIYSAGRQMNEIIKSFLHILRLETGKQTRNLVSTDLTLVAKSVLSELELNAKRKNIRFVEQYQTSLPVITTDADLVRVIVQNFVSNAVKYSSKGSQIIVALKMVDKGILIAGKTVQTDSLLISVQDSGIGIPQNDKNKIFTKFFRSENARKQDPNGNGLGLYMAKIMVDIIGGVLWFESEEEKGTTFYVLLPIDGGKLV